MSSSVTVSGPKLSITNLHTTRPSDPVSFEMNFFAAPIDVDIKLEGEDLRKQVDMKTDKDKTISCPVYYDGESLMGQVMLLLDLMDSKLCLCHGPDNYSCTRWEEDDTRRYQGRVRWQYWYNSLPTTVSIMADSFSCILELFYDRGHHHEFLSLSQELAAPGEMRQAQTFDFNFKNVEKQFESYHGINVKLRYAC